MPPFKPQSYRKVIKILRKHGFVFRRATGGSHEIWWNETKKKTCVVPHHQEIKAGTLKNIAHQAQLPMESFFK